MSLLKKTCQAVFLFCRMVKIEHSVFALPFAFIGLIWAADGWAGWGSLLWLTLAMVGVRSFAMGFNRLADLEFDRINPRTAGRPLVTGEISVAQTKKILIGCALVFIFACAKLNMTCLQLSIPALAWTAFYSYTKRFSRSCHFWLGSVLGLAPIAGSLAYNGSLELGAALLGLAVTFWVAGFDIIYSCQDVEFDRAEELYSLPATMGEGSALYVARLSHFTAALLFGAAGWAEASSWPYGLVWVLASGMLFWEHLIISEDDLAKVNMAFFNMNGIIAIAFLAGVIADTALR